MTLFNIYSRPRRIQALDEMTRERRAPRLRWGRSDGGAPASYTNELKVRRRGVGSESN